MSGMITDLTALASGSVDRTTDLLEIVDLSANTSYKITVNNLVGITGCSVVSTSDTQTLTNKVIGITNTITALDTLFTLQDNSDNTKQLQFQLSGITTGTTRTVTLPDATGTLVLTAATQTLTNKTLTSPTITGGTIDNTTITVDAVSGHTTSTIVTIANLQISNGVLNTANAVTATSIAAGAVQPQALVSGTGSGWAWQSWTPTWTNLTVGNGTTTAKYIQIGKSVCLRLNFVLGTTSAIGTNPTFTLPVTAVSYGASGTAVPILGSSWYEHTGTGSNMGWCTMPSTTTANPVIGVASSTYFGVGAISATAPFTWATGDSINTTFVYEAA